ncbi:MAG: triose-phosphate isomerase [Candidatus Helarchaeota archaeon]
MKDSSPVILLNYKTYYEATGWRAINLSESADRLAKEYGVNIIVAPQFVDIAPIADQFDIPVYAQHVDPITPGSHTGHILPESIKEAGAVGTLLNHAERKLPFEILEETIQLVRKLDLKTCICAENIEVAGKTADLNPTYVAFELPELIGTGQSISTTEPELVKSSVKQIIDANSEVIPLCGAGISDGKDVYAALKLGTHGVLLASAVTKAKDPEFVLIDLINGINKYLDEQ